MKITSVQGLNTPTIYDYYQRAKVAVKEALNNYPHKELLGTKTDELTEYLFQQHALSPLEIDESRSIEWEKIISKERRNTFVGEPITVDITRVKVIFPIKPGLKLPDALSRVFGKVEGVHLDWEDGSCYNGKSEVEPNLLNSKCCLSKYFSPFGQ